MARAKGLCRVDSEGDGYQILLIGVVRQAVRDARSAPEPQRSAAARWLHNFAPEVSERLEEHEQHREALTGA